MAARLLTQRAHLDEAARLIRGIPGPVFEIGLGKGRTYSHLRLLLPEREIYCFDRELHAAPADTPPRDYLMLGEFEQTLPKAAARIGAPVALAHCDFGSRHPQRDARAAAALAELLPGIMAAGAIVLSDRPLASRRLDRITAPAVAPANDLPAWNYYCYRVAAARTT
jgi:hypothetical protein